jgi:molybdate transport system substrate-binding protein
MGFAFAQPTLRRHAVDRTGTRKEFAMKVLCTNGVKAVLLEIVPEFERTHSIGVEIAWGSTKTLLEDLEAGAVGDLIVATDEAIDDLIERGRVAPGTRMDLARSGIGVAVRKGAAKPDIGSPEALRRALLAAKSVSHSRTGLSGIYFPTVLARLGIADSMRSKIVMPASGTPVGEVVARGEAEIGIQQISELLPVAGIEIVGPLPPELQKITIFSAGVLAAAQEPEAAKALAHFIATRSKPLLREKGLEPP